MNIIDPPQEAVRRPGGRLLLALGPILAIIGVLAYWVQVATARLSTPWYMPILATLGVLCVVIALRQAPSIRRGLVLVLVIVLAAAQWTFILGTRLPSYTGAVASGQPFPTFATLRADGSAFTDRDLLGPNNTVLVFFRGRW